MSNVLEMIGQTPLIRLDKIAKSEGLQCDLCKFVCYIVCLCVRGLCLSVCLCVYILYLASHHLITGSSTVI